MRLSALFVSIVFCGTLASGVSRRTAPDKNAKSVQQRAQGTASPESQDLDDFNPHVQPGPHTQDVQEAEDDIDELEGDLDESPTGPHVHFADAPQTPVRSTDDGRENAQDRTPEPPRVPSTPNSLGRYLLGHQRSASDTDLYHRPSHLKSRQAQPQDDELERKWHRWYIFNNEDRRKRYSDMKKQLTSTSHDISASTGATFLSFLGRPEKDPAHPEYLGEMTASRDIKRNPKLLKISEQLFDQWKKLVALVRRQEYEEEVQRAIQARDEHAAAVQQYESRTAAREQASREDAAKTTQSRARNQKRKRAGGKDKGKARADDTDASASGSTRSEDDAPDLDATPRRPPPNLRGRQAHRLPESGEDESDRADVPEPQRLFMGGGTLGFEDMAIDDEDFALQLGEAVQQNRREQEAHNFRRSKRGESSGQHGASSSSDRGRTMDVDDDEERYSSRSRINRGPDADASNSASSRRDGPSTRSTTRAGGGASIPSAPPHAAIRPAAAQNGSDVFVGPSGLVAEVVLPLRARPLTAAPSVAQGPSVQQPQHARQQQLHSGSHGSGSRVSRGHQMTDASSASGSSRGSQSVRAPPAPIAQRNGMPPPRTARSAAAPASVRGRSPPASVRGDSPPASVRAPVRADRQHAPPASSRARSPSISAHRHPLSSHSRSPPGSVPATLDAGATSESETHGLDTSASELPTRIRNWLIVNRIHRTLWDDVEIAYFTGLAEQPAARRAAWTAELEQLQATLLFNPSQLRELVLAMLRSAVDR